ncbi:MAG: c-type cytochrome [Rhodomicrobium sp.]
MQVKVSPFHPRNPWRWIGWLTAAITISLALFLGLVVLSPYQQNGPRLGTWAAICRSLGITSDTSPAEEPQPPLRVPSLIAWTPGTLDMIRAGNAKQGSFVALNCTACHGEGGVSQSALIPTLAGMDAPAIYKQLEDFRTGKRQWGVMQAIAKALSPQDSADVAAHFASLSKEPAAIGQQQFPLLEEEPLAAGGLQKSDPTSRLVHAGDQGRTIAPCTACHGPAGRKLGAPPIADQQAAYIERQLASFAQGIRDNDIGEQMRVIAKGLTPDEMHALAAFYGRGEAARVAEK